MKPANNAYFIRLVELDSEKEVMRVTQENIFLAKTPFLHIFERGRQCLEETVFLEHATLLLLRGYPERYKLIKVILLLLLLLGNIFYKRS